MAELRPLFPWGNREFKHQQGYNGVGMRFLHIQGLKRLDDQILSMDKVHSFY